MYDELVNRLRLAKAVLSRNKDLIALLSDAADAIEELSMKLHGDEAAISGMKREIERMVVSGNKPRWIPVTERLPETDDEVVVAFKNSEDGEWWYRIDNFVDGAFCYNTAFNRNIEYWMPLPEPPKEE